MSSLAVVALVTCSLAFAALAVSPGPGTSLEGFASDHSTTSMGPNSDRPCDGRARYEVNFDFRIQAGNGNFTDGLAAAPTTLAAHKSEYTMWVPFGYASPGVALVAETGDPTLLREELDAAGDLVRSYRGTDAPGPGNGSVTLNIVVNGKARYLSSAAMVAPSGDWFFGLQRMNMCNEDSGMFYSGATIPLRLYDAGVDSLEIFSFDPEMETNPVENIQRLEEFPTPNGEVVAYVTIQMI